MADEHPSQNLQDISNIFKPQEKVIHQTMAAKTNFHVRSNSFPTKSHPLLQQCKDHLQRLSSSSNSATSSSITLKLISLEELHDCVDELLQLQVTRQAFRGETEVDRIIDGSLRVVEMCSEAKNAVSHTKECVRDIQSAMRRRRGAPASLDAEIAKYSASRKVVKKAIHKCLKSSKTVSYPANQDQSEITVLQEVEAVTCAVLDSLMQFVSGNQAQTKLGSWSLVSKLMHKKVSSCPDSDMPNEFSQVDVALGSSTSPEKAQRDLQNLDECVRGFEGRLESLFRRLIKTRVSLLNILNN